MDRDQQVRLEFLDEAEEYFNSLESLLMDLDAQGAEPSLLDGAMRAAHSLKGGAAMMQFVPLSKTAHRLEDFLKILRVRKDDSLVDREVTTLLLQGVDSLRAIRNLHQQQTSIDEYWLEQNTAPVFARLRQRLGELKEEDEDLLLAEEEQIDVSSLIFQSGVEDCLESFEAKIDVLEPAQLKEELALQAEQLAEIGQMSQIEPFVQLCQSVQQQLAVVSLAEVRDLADQAFKLWERSHALVLVGRIDKLPTQLGNVATSSAVAVNSSQPDITTLLDTAELEEAQNFAAQLASESQAFSDSQFNLNQLALDAEELSELDAAFEPLNASDSSSEVMAEASSDNIDLDQFAPDAEELSELDAAFEPLNVSDSSSEVIAEGSSDNIDLDQFALDADELSELTAVFAAVELPSAQVPISQQPEVVSTLPSTEVKQQPQPKSEQGRMVRVPAQQLQRLNDLSSKLILERNAAILRLNQLQNFVGLTKERMRRLEKSSNQLRKLYDWASLEGMIPTAQSATVINTEAWESVSSASTTEKFDSLEMDHYTDLHLLSQEQMETIVQLQEVTTDIDLGIREMGQVIRNFSYTTRDLQQSVTRSQMRPFSELVGRFPRLIRDLSTQHNKQVNLKIEGETTFIDRQALESLSDPLTHLLRNAFDHGLEDAATRLAAGKPAEGTIVLKAAQRGNQTIITITDDGGGINPQKIRDRLLKMGFSQAEVDHIPEENLLDAIFEPGFSTANQVTELSGRGVGMDVVKSNLQQIRGDIQVQTELGQGTTFTLSVPLSLLVLRVVIVESAGMVFAIPVQSIREIIKFNPELTSKVGSKEQVNWNNQPVPLMRLDKYLQFRRPGKSFEMEGIPKIQTPTILIFEENTQLKGIYLEKYWNEQEVAIRNVKTSIPLFPGFTGSTVLGDGRVIPLIEPSAFSQGITKQQKASFSTSTNIKDISPTVFPVANVTTILIVDDSVNVRRYLANILERNGYRVEEAKDGRDAVDKLIAGLQVQAIICDVEMPRLDGYGVLSEVKSEPNLASIPIAMLTSRSNDKHRKLAMKLGASAYFSKPFNEQEMLQTLSNLVSEYN